MQKMLVDKINLHFLRDSQFSNINNLFSTRYVKNVESASSSTPFLIVSDEKGMIKFSKPVSKIEKILNQIKSLFIEGN